MKQLFAAILLALVGPGAWAASSGFDSGGLYKLCSNPLDNKACTAFIMGVAQGIDVKAWMDKTAECLPETESTNEDMAHIVTGYLAAHKEQFSMPAASAVILALGSKECAAKLVPQR